MFDESTFIFYWMLQVPGSPSQHCTSKQKNIAKKFTKLCKVPGGQSSCIFAEQAGVSLGSVVGPLSILGCDVWLLRSLVGRRPLKPKKQKDMSYIHAFLKWLLCFCCSICLGWMLRHMQNSSKPFVERDRHVLFFFFGVVFFCLQQGVIIFPNMQASHLEILLSRWSFQKKAG